MAIKLYFKKAGLQSLIVDQGRTSYQAFGVPVSGAMDRKAAQTANELVGNPKNSPLLEMTIIGPTIAISESCQIALTGANLSPQLNGQNIPLYQTIDIQDDATLSFGKCLAGCRAYLAIGGKWQVNKWLDSASAFPLQANLTPDSIIQKGSQIAIEPKEFIDKKISTPILSFSFPINIPVLPGPEFELFSRQNIAHFFSQIYSVHPQSNRMAYRLTPNLSLDHEISIISSAIVRGTIQISHAGQAIILMADAQTTGGYPRIANITEKALDIIAQLKANDCIQFSCCGDLREEENLGNTL